MYKAKCGLAYNPSVKHKAKSYMVILETDQPLLDENGKPTRKINPPKECNSKCLRKRRPHIIYQLREKDLVPVLSWRCRFTKEV